jgi:hypothetical protein
MKWEELRYYGEVMMIYGGDGRVVGWSVVTGDTYGMRGARMVDGGWVAEMEGN